MQAQANGTSGCFSPLYLNLEPDNRAGSLLVELTLRSSACDAGVSLLRR